MSMSKNQGKTMQATQRLANHIDSLAIQDKEQASVLRESYGQVLKRKRTILPLQFASYSPEDGLVKVRLKPIEVIEVHLGKPHADCPECHGTGETGRLKLHCPCKYAGSTSREATDKDRITVFIED